MYEQFMNTVKANAPTALYCGDCVGSNITIHVAILLPLLNPQSNNSCGDTLDGTLGSLRLTAEWKDLGPGQRVFGVNGCNIPLHSCNRYSYYDNLFNNI